MNQAPPLQLAVQLVQRLGLEAAWADRLAPDASSRPTLAAMRKAVDEPTFLAALAEVVGLPFKASLADLQPSAAFTAAVPIGFARRFQMLGLESPDDGPLTVALADLAFRPQLETAARRMGRAVALLLAPSEQIQAGLNRAYQERTGQAQALIQQLDRDQVLESLAHPSKDDLLDVAGRAPVIQLVNLILFEAVQGRASDVHIQPVDDQLLVRLRIDGLLFDAFKLAKELQEEVVSRVKVIGRMNIAEKLVAQDGRASVQVGDRLIDLRIASLPTSHGERVVIRLLDRSARLYKLPDLGMAEDVLVKFRSLIAHEHGLVLVTGPTGSGKSTTLYAALQEINRKERNILTLEDPIEYQLDGVSQTQVTDKKGMTFASGLRSVLRQDPDVIMVGEIRDRETAVMAIQSSLTGHLVFSTLHTNDAPSAVTRLLDLGIEPYLVASSLIGVLAQRLVRQVCPACATPATREELPSHFADLNYATADLSRIRIGRGCDSCRGTGYRGRIAVSELLPIDEEIQSIVQERANATQIKQIAVRRGMRTLRQDGVLKTLAGVTTLEEVARVAL